LYSAVADGNGAVQALKSQRLNKKFFCAGGDLNLDPSMVSRLSTTSPPTTPML